LGYAVFGFTRLDFESNGFGFLGFRVWAAPNKRAKGYPFAVLANRKTADTVMADSGKTRTAMTA
jgi:hypothetical protein